MKLNRYIAAFASLAVIAGCAKEYEVSHLDEIQLSETFISIPAEGGSVKVEVNATVDWAFEKLFETDEEKTDENGNVIYEDHDAVMVYSETPDWLNIDKLNGTAGPATLTFSAEDNKTVGREAKLVIKAGDKYQNLTVRQGDMTASIASVKDVFDGAEGQTFVVTGTCVSIANTSYGNWYMADETTDEQLYIYGTVDDTGNFNWDSFNIEVGDVVTVRGTKKMYGSTVEFENAKFISVEKSLLQGVSTDIVIDSEGGKAVAKFIVKGNGLMYDEISEDVKSWVEIASISEEEDSTVVTFNISPAVDKTAKRECSITFRSGSSEVPVSILQYPDPVAKMSDVFGKIESKGLVAVEGVIAATCSNGFLLSKDNDLILVYASDFADVYDGKTGYTVRVLGKADKYNGGPQIGSVDFVQILEKGTYTETQNPVDLSKDAAIDTVVPGDDGLYDITYFTASGSLSDPYHNLSIAGAETALAFYGNNAFDLDAYCDYCNKGETPRTITVTGYYISKQSTRINFIVTDIKPELEEE